MEKTTIKVPKRVGGIRIKKKDRQQLKALVRAVQRHQEVEATTAELLTALGIAKGTESPAKEDRKVAY